MSDLRIEFIAREYHPNERYIITRAKRNVSNIKNNVTSRNLRKHTIRMTLCSNVFNVATSGSAA
jgi:hypothetical protein